MIILNNPVISKIVQALCWTLIQSLWQGLILAVLTGIVLMTTRKSSPASRYNLLTGLLFLFVPAIGYTFWNELNVSYGSTALSIPVQATTDIAPLGSPVSGNIFHVLATRDLLTNTAISFLNSNALWIVSLWFLIFSIKSIRTVSGIFYVNKIRSRSVHEVSEQWKWHLRQLGQKIGMYERIELVTSEIVHVPLVVGFFKPIIIVPLGFLTDLPVGQIEAILLHELAHVKRRDYLVNLLQSFGETLFFFNPAVLWLSALIRQEREHCCDDLAISVLGDKSSFVNALVSFQEYNLSHSGQAVAFAGRRNHLLDRIKRIIYNNNKQLNAMEKLFVTASFIMVAGLSIAFSPPKPVEPASKGSEKKLIAQNEGLENLEKPEIMAQVSSESVIHLGALAPADTLRRMDIKSLNSNDGITNMDFTRDRKKYNVVADGDEIIYLKIDGQKISKEEISKYKPEIDQMLVDVKKAHVEADVLRQEAEIMRKQADENRSQADVMRKHAEEMRLEANENRNQSRNVNIDAEIFRKAGETYNKNIEEFKKMAEHLRVEMEGTRKQAEQMKLDAEKQRKEAFKYREEADQHRQNAEVHRKEAEKMRAEYEKMQDELISELTREGIIENNENQHR